MDSAPPYFESVRADAQRRWDQLEADPELAAPWHQLFRQVQSPRHVLSELLQNADDAGANWARVSLSGDTFRFEHNGQDFDEPAFRSLCRFGFSNKRHLHTIGFRGIGFKSTFSVGPRVELHTPSLRVAFDRTRFTEPVWLAGEAAGLNGSTRVQIALDRPEVRAWLSEDLRRWAADPLPILFFRNLKSLDLQGAHISRTVEGPGPVPGSTWTRLQGLQEHLLLRIASDEAPFPDEAIEEVRAERGDAAFELPPCTVELIVGAPDPRLYVVLPTEVRVGLPFAVNAPFLQDPARTGIKDPTGSATNRWLLRRVGELAAESIHTWVSTPTLTLKDRAQAYAALLPKKPDYEVRSLSADAEAAVREGVGEHLRRKPILLTSEGEVVLPRAALDLSPDVLGVWPGPVALDLFGDGEAAVLAPEVGRDGRRRLEEWDLLDRFDASAFLARLQVLPRPPRPEDDAALVRLWAIVQGLLGQVAHRRVRAGALALVPVSNGAELHPSDDVVLAGGSEARLRPEDWALIGRHVPLAEPKWVSLLLSASQQTGENAARLDAAARLFRSLDLAARTGLQGAVFGAAREIFELDSPGYDGIQIALVAARADLQVPVDFQFLCTDGTWREVREGLLVDAEDMLSFFPPDWVTGRLVAAWYATEGSRQDQEMWRLWATSSKSGLRQFILPSTTSQRVYGRKKGEALVAERGGRRPDAYRLTTYDFQFDDIDFDDALWAGWVAQAETDASVWPAVLRGIQADWGAEWTARSKAQLWQSGNKYRYAVDHGTLAPAWITRLRGLRCLPDTHGRLRTPAELYRTNASTAHLTGVEPFLAAELDTDAAAELLALLGVRERPDSLDALLSRIRALSGSGAPAEVVSMLYHALDRSVGHVSGEALAAARDAFASESLIRDEGGAWYASPAIFQRNDDAVPGVPVLAPDVAGLRLWDRIGVPVRPTADAVLAWLRSLPTGEVLDVASQARARALLPRLPQRAWEEGGAWLDAAGGWTPTAALEYASADASSVHGLFAGFRRSVADLSMLSEALRVQPPFSLLTPLDRAVEYRVAQADRLGPPAHLPWMAALADGLGRVAPDPDVPPDVMDARREAAARLGRTQWQRVRSVEAEPMVDGRPVGQRRAADVLWAGETLYAVGDGPRVHAALVRTVAQPFDEGPVRHAVEACVGRPPDWVRDYLEATFVLEPGTTVQAPAPPPVPEARPPEPAETAPLAVPEPDSELDSEPMDDDAEPLDSNVEARHDGTNPDDRDDAQRAPRDDGPGRAFVTYWQERGYALAGARAFRHPDGRRLEREGGVFPWTERNAEGSVRGLYWTSRHALATGVEVPAEVWDLLRRTPAAALLLADGPDGLIRYGWDALEPGVAVGAFVLHAAGYRLTRPDASAL